MGKDDKEDSGFGFKDKAKAEETLKLLEAHDMNYRRLTVRGLLGRAKRVLTLTKAEEKIKNIKEAMAVFEDWLADLEKNKQTDKKKDTKKVEIKKKTEENDDGEDSNSSVSSDSEPEKSPEKAAPPSDTVPGLGFKDKSAAEQSIKVLEGRDPDYQKLAVKGLIGRAKRVLTCTKDETKVSNIKEAVSVLDQFLDDFDSLHLSKQNNPYLPLDVTAACLTIAEERKLDVSAQKPFIEAYRKVKGEYKKLRTVAEKEDGQTWDIVRNKALKPLKEKYGESKLFNSKDEPTDDHLHLLLWAYSPDATRAKKYIPAAAAKKRRSSGGAEATPNKKSKE